ncbi:MAG TPA: membrane dipeptidase [Mycobacteriales bacterium]|nr:membrane dipeptidase [Mycobacteriales bacterium]
MINSYVGGVGYDVIAQHGMPGSKPNVLADIYVPKWSQGGLTGAVIQAANWMQFGNYFSEFNRGAGRIAYCSTRADYENRPAGSFGLFISVEGHGPFAGDFEALYVLDQLGATTFTFSHNRQNLLCTGSNEPLEGGFSYLGKQTLKELEETKLMVDLVHMSRASFWDALRYYDGPLFVSHSNADALCQHPRNLTDDQIKAVAERNGVVGLNSFKGYVHNDPMKATLSDVLDHAMYIYDLVGPEHMCLGLDYCESPVEMLIPVLDWVDPEGAHGIKGRGRELYEFGPEGLEFPSEMGKLAAGLAERGLNQQDINLITGESYLRMLDRARPSA